MALERWNGSVWVTIAVGTRPMCRVSGATRAAISTASSRPRTWSVRSSGRSAAGRLEAEGVLDGDEVEQSVLGLSDQVGPVAGGEQLGGAGGGLPPGGRMPAGAVEGDGQMEIVGCAGRAGQGCARNGHGRYRFLLSGNSAEWTRAPDGSTPPGTAGAVRQRAVRGGTVCRVAASPYAGQSAPATRSRSIWRRENIHER